jgi:ZIP family zinc transporter
LAGDLLPAILLASLAGGSILLGAALAAVPRLASGWIEEEFRHTVIAFGAGALFAAIALVLVPEGAERLAPPWVLLAFALGGLAAFAADKALARRGGHAAQFMAMMLDYVPEALAMGALIAGQADTALLLALVIALQNLPESFNAYREIDQPEGPGRRRLLLLFALMVPVGPACAVLGLLFLGDAPALLGAIMLFSAGGILYLMLQDVAPQVPLDRAWGPPLGGVAGFLLGLAGHLTIG